MQIRYRRRATRGGLLAIAAVIALAVSACSSSGGSSSTNPQSPAQTGGTSSEAPSTPSGPTTLRIAYNPNPTNTSLIVAQQQGFFTKNGLDVKLTSTQASAALMPSLGKQFDLITVTVPTLLQSAAAGHKPILVAAEDIENTSNLRNTYLIGAKSVKAVADLKGKKIGVPSLSGNLYESAVILLHNAGIEKTDVKFLQVPFPSMAGDLDSGTIQAAVTIFPFQNQLLHQGFPDLGNPMSFAVTSDGFALSAGWAGYAPWVATHKEAVEAFFKAQEEALTWMKANMDGARQVLVKDFQLPEFVAKTFPVTQFVSFEPKAAYLDPWIAPMKAVGDLPASFDTPTSDLVYQH